MLAEIERMCANGQITVGLIFAAVCVLMFIGAVLLDCAEWLYHTWRHWRRGDYYGCPFDD